MFKKLKEYRSLFEEAEKSLKSAISEGKKLNKENKLLLSKIEAAEKRNGVLLLDDLTTETIEKLQELTDDNVIIIFTQNDNSRIEIRSKDNYNRINKGAIH